MGFLELTKEGDKIKYDIVEGKSNLDPRVRRYLESVENELEKERDSKTMISTEK